MSLHREQHVRKPTQHIRPDRLALEAASKTEHDILVDRDREMIGPELRKSLDERTIGGHGLTQSRGGLGDVDRPINLPNLHNGGNSVLLAVCWRAVREGRTL